jgi:hypothetical protein
LRIGVESKRIAVIGAAAVFAQRYVVPTKHMLATRFLSKPDSCD